MWKKITFFDKKDDYEITLKQTTKHSAVFSDQTFVFFPVYFTCIILICSLLNTFYAWTTFARTSCSHSHSSTFPTWKLPSIPTNPQQGSGACIRMDRHCWICPRLLISYGFHSYNQCPFRRKFMWLPMNHLLTASSFQTFIIMSQTHSWIGRHFSNEGDVQQLHGCW